VNNDLLYPKKPEKDTWVVCGHTLITWNHAVVYVRDWADSFSPPTHLHFNYIGSGDCYLDEIGVLVGQWTFYNQRCINPYLPSDDEYIRGYRAAWKAVASFREYYLEKYGSPPDPLGLGGEISPELLKRATNLVNKRLGY
jgi:hypothetical protein